jgi:glucokinase
MKKYLGVDIGGSKIKKIEMSDGNIISGSFEIIDTPKNMDKFLSSLANFIIASVSSSVFSGIGLCLPGMLDIKNKILSKAPNLPFLNGWNFGEFLDQFGLPFKVENDSKCFLLAEFKLGIVKNYKNIVGLNIGTGIGGGLIIDGKIYPGAHNNAQEFGHMIIDNFKTLEELGSAKTILNKDDRAKIIGAGVSNLINAFDPEAVVLGGGGVVDGYVDVEEISKWARKFIISPLCLETPILKTKLGFPASAIGAALLCGK